MSETTRSEAAAVHVLLSKVPAVTVWFWIIKILCTTVGESVADWINVTLGVGLSLTAVIFTLVLAAVLGWQLRLDRYVPFVYWLSVVVLSVTGTLYTDILTDNRGVPLALSTGIFTAVLVIVFGMWFAREQTLSIHSIVTLPRELFYWLAVLVTFALGTAAGDWTLELTGWGPGTSVLLPVGLIIAIVIGRRLGANAVLSFWLAYILTRPLGANLGDWLASPATDHGLGVGTAATSVIFLAAILASVVYLTRTHRDVIAAAERTHTPTVTTRPDRERVMIGYYVAVAVATGALLVWAAAQPHATVTSEDDATAAPEVTSLSSGEATTHFPQVEVAKFRTIAQDTLLKVQAGDQAGAKAQIKDLETAWDDDEATLRSLDKNAWNALDEQIDSALKAVRAGKPDNATETKALTALLTALG
ncbi:COG4705 family protein [Nocardia sp. NBC_00403]|uniref:COG4705 family protein n=1 Tax=Nocardia sp. NBC_00403 TaxID=2975990 RepID=UPI002E1DA9CC